MKSDIDIKELWRKQAVPFADCSGLFKEVNHFKRKKVLELIVLNAVLWMTICFVAFVWIYFKPQLLVTKIGILLTIVAMGTVAVFTHKPPSSAIRRIALRINPEARPRPR